MCVCWIETIYHIYILYFFGNIYHIYICIKYILYMPISCRSLQAGSRVSCGPPFIPMLANHGRSCFSELEPSSPRLGDELDDATRALGMVWARAALKSLQV